MYGEFSLYIVVIASCYILLCLLLSVRCGVLVGVIFCFQAEDGIRDLVRSRGLGDVYKRQAVTLAGIGLQTALSRFSLEEAGFAGLVVLPRNGLSLIHI